MPEHVDISTDEIHIAHNYVYADATAREAASLLSADIGKIAKQTDNKSFWVLADNTGPIWLRLSVGAIVNAQTGTSYTVLAKDRGKLVTHSNASAIAVTLPVASTTGFGADWFYETVNLGAGLVTITPTTSTINGAATLTLYTGQGCKIVSDGTNYFVVRGKSPLSVDEVNSSVFAADAGANDTYVATLSPAPAALVTGNHYRFKANTANTGACTINFNGLGAKTIKKAEGGITTDLADNDIRAGQWVDLVYDGTNMQMQSNLGNTVTSAAPSGSAGGALGGTYPNPTVKVALCVAASDETTALTTGTAKLTFRMPHAMTLTDIRASLSTGQTSGSIFTVDVNESGTTIISTKITIDNGEKTSTTAATPPVISDASLADDAEITIDIDQVGDGTAKGLKVYLIGTRA